MADGFDIRAGEVVGEAARVRGDAIGIDEARRAGSAAARAAAAASGEGPLSGVAEDVASGLDQAIGRLREGLVEWSAAVEGAAARYRFTDATSARRFSGVSLPGFDGPPGADPR